MNSPHHPGHDHANGARTALTSRAAAASISMALFLIGLKTWASWDTGSVAMLGSLADTTLDLVASLVTFFGVRYAAVPPDDDHRFGHGKAEAIAALFQVMLIGVSAVGIAWRAIERLGSGAATEGLETGVAVSFVAMGATFALLAYQRHVIRKTGSVAIMTDHVHYQSDLLLNFAVIVALALDQMLGLHWADPIFGVAIALWLLWGAWRATRHAIDELMDREWLPAKRQAFLDILLSHPELAGVHGLRTRTSGGRDFAQFNVWVDPGMTLAEAHRIMDEVEDKLRREFPGTDILIHPEPQRQAADRDRVPAGQPEHHP